MDIETLCEKVRNYVHNHACHGSIDVMALFLEGRCITYTCRLTNMEAILLHCSNVISRSCNTLIHLELMNTSHSVAFLRLGGSIYFLQSYIDEYPLKYVIVEDPIPLISRIINFELSPVKNDDEHFELFHIRPTMERKLFTGPVGVIVKVYLAKCS